VTVRLIVGVLAVLAAACGPAQGAGEGVEGRIVVSAAASLTDAFAAVAVAFEEAHPGVSVALNIAGSSLLREQIREGAPVDVFASANTANMDQLVASGDVVAPEIFASNLLAIGVPAGNSAGVDGLDDFADEALLIGLCTRDVPCGEFGRLILARAGVVPALDTDEPDVRALLTKIEAGELDAGIVYVTDVASSAGVDGIPIDPKDNIVAEYPIARLTGSANPETGDAFVAFVLSAGGQEILGRFGFVVP